MKYYLIKYFNGCSYIHEIAALKFINSKDT